MTIAFSGLKPDQAILYMDDLVVFRCSEKHRHIFITTDASKLACSAVLTQEYEGRQLPVAYISGTFTKGESNKSTIERELTAIRWAITHFRPYVYGKYFLVLFISIHKINFFTIKANTANI